MLGLPIVIFHEARVWRSEVLDARGPEDGLPMGGEAGNQVNAASGQLQSDEADGAQG